MQPLIKFDHVTYKFGNGVVALDDFSCEIKPGEFVFLVGPSGAGKTTFLRLLLKELKTDKNKLFFDGEDLSSKKVKITKLRRKIGVAFQDSKLLLDHTVYENVAMVMEILGKKNSEIKSAVEASLDLVGLVDKAEFFPAQLSGGEIQRVGLARAVVGDPKLVFADEPTANLDDESSWKIASLLKEIHRSGKTVIVATHNMEIVEAIQARVINLKKNQ